MPIPLVLRSFALGAATGLRSMTGPAAVSGGTAWERLLPLLALGEFMADKVPQIPSRTIPPSLALRVLAGGLAADAIARRRDGNRAVGVVAGMLGALAGAYAGAAYRDAASRRFPPVLCALLEDGAAIALARGATSG